MCFRPATVQQDKRCPFCSSSNTLDAEVCGACGAELPTASSVSAPVPAGAKMPGAFGDSGTDGGGFQPRIPQAPASPGAPNQAASPNQTQQAESQDEG